MSSMPSETFESLPEWFWSLLGASGKERRVTHLRALGLELDGGLPRARTAQSGAQGQTAEAFGFKWAKRDTYESQSGRAHMREWLERRYGESAALPFLHAGTSKPIVLDAGCGAGYSALELFEPILGAIRYLGVDISAAVDVARERFAERGFRDAAFMQADILRLPLPDESVDAVFSEGVLHHTDSTREALLSLAGKIRPRGWFLFYVYRRKGPIREFSDDYIREKLQALSPEDAWNALQPLSKLGRALGELNVDVDVPDDVTILQIPAGRMDLQRLFYWHVCKAFYRPDMTLDEMNHINFDWYAPKNAHRQSPEEVREWCAEARLDIVREMVEEAGITVVARKRGR